MGQTGSNTVTSNGVSLEIACGLHVVIPCTRAGHDLVGAHIPLRQTVRDNARGNARVDALAI
eukprot:7466479-Lingulodinium_polyedra.AAC.1